MLCPEKYYDSAIILLPLASQGSLDEIGSSSTTTQQKTAGEEENIRTQIK